MNIETLKQIVSDILSNTPHRPFLCLPLSALLYATLKDHSLADPSLVTGDLFYKKECIFKQDFSIADAKDSVYQDWAGHAWVEIGELICDLSIFRTIYSDKFTKPFKLEIISFFGEGRGCLIGTKESMLEMHLCYRKQDNLSDDLATGIIQGFDPLLKL